MARQHKDLTGRQSALGLASSKSAGDLSPTTTKFHFQKTPRDRPVLTSPVQDLSTAGLKPPRLRPNGVLEMTKRQMSSSVVIYRSAKYDGVLGRWKAYLRTYAQLVVRQAAGPIMLGFHKYLIQILGAMYLAFLAPLNIFIALVLLLLRKMRFYLVRYSIPEAVICDDLSPRCIFDGKSMGMVTCVLWLNGRLDPHLLRSSLHKKTKGMWVLRQKLDEKFGLRVLVEPGERFNINDHVTEAPRELVKHFLNSERLFGGKSALEQFVTKCASETLNPGTSPWKITVIPLPAFNKEKTCCVLRFHSALLNFSEVRQSFLENMFTQSIYEDMNATPFAQDASICTVMSTSVREFDSFYSHPLLMRDSSETLNAENASCKFESLAESFRVDDSLSISEVGREIQMDFHRPVENVMCYTIRTSAGLCHWLRKNLYVSRSDVTAWMNLRKKQMLFHTKAAVLRTVLKECLLFYRKLIVSAYNLPGGVWWGELKEVLSQVFLILRAASFVTTEIFSVLLSPIPRRSGFSRTDHTGTRRIAWSSPISMELVSAIRARTGATTESIMLTACSMALKDYYCETGLQNPSHIGVLVPVATSDLLAPSGYVALDLKTDPIDVPQQVQSIDHKLRSTETWMLLGRYYLLKYISYFLPRALAYLVMRKLFRRYPISFTKVNLQSPNSMLLPHISLWDKTVEDISLWKPPHSDFCVSVSLICYAETVRLSVLSPMKYLDTALARRFPQNLNRIAELVGVDKGLIPYSRRSSPSSSYCPSPSLARSQEQLHN